MIGLGAHGTGSSSATHPAAVFGPGGRPAGDTILVDRVTKGAVEHAYWRYEDQLNSCVGQADENGWRRASPVDWRESAAQAREASRKRSGQNSYLAFGEVMQSRVLYDVDRRETGRRDAPVERPKDKVSRLSAVEYDGLALTTITLANNDLSTDLLNGKGTSRTSRRSRPLGLPETQRERHKAATLKVSAQIPFTLLSGYNALELKYTRRSYRRAITVLTAVTGTTRGNRRMFIILEAVRARSTANLFGLIGCHIGIAHHGRAQAFTK
ncbi:MAG: hypothetical protein BroJett014_20660 [Planctomycetota bacterium]|nr:MAG: hypothetical protein BroJett014_20660 [Planctomycetota bacterium]